MKITKEQTHPNLPCQARGSASFKAAGMPVKRTTKNQITTLTVANVTSLKAINTGQSGGKRIPQGCWWQCTLATASRMDSL